MQWDTVLVMIVVGGAVVYLVRRFARKKASGCSCGSQGCCQQARNAGSSGGVDCDRHA